ncbi:MAG: hypothetical protein J6D06_08110 [Clostridia bacterium]|nr:hypothetical protein [Clostridia bacterium]
MAKLKHLCNIYFAQNSKIIILFMFITSIYTGYRIMGAKLSAANVFEFMLEMLSDFHLIIFVLLPIFGFCVFSTLSSHKTMEIIRYRCFQEYFFIELVPSIIFAFLFVVIILGFSLIFSLALNFSAIMQPTGYFDNTSIGAILSNSPNAILNALLCTSLYLFIGLIFIAITVKFLFYLIPKKALLLIVALEYILSVLAVQWNYDEIFPYIFLNNYTILHNAINNNCSFIQTTIIFITVAFVVIATKKRWGCSDL